MLSVLLCHIIAHDEAINVFRNVLFDIDSIYSTAYSFTVLNIKSHINIQQQNLKVT